MRAIILTVIILSIILLVRVVFNLQDQKEYKVGENLEAEITLLSEPRIQFESQVFYIGNVRIESNSRVELNYGDKISVSGMIESRTFTPKNSKTNVNQLYIKNPEVQVLAQKNPFITSTAFLRKRIVSEFNSVLPHNESALLFGIVFGGSQDFSPELKDQFRNTGVLHVIAASGMNVSMVASFLIGFFSLFLKRRTALILAICGIFYYALLSGFAPSILRASIMASAAFGAGILGRQNYAFLSLFLAAWVMIIIAPEILFDIGFLLSFFSTLGILLIKPLFDQVRIIKKTKAFSDDVATTISAQVGSLPILIGSFSSYSLISIFVNAIVLWTIPFLMILGGIAALCAIALPFVTFIPLYTALPLLWYFESVIHLFGSILPVNIENIPVMIWVGYYLILFSLVIKLKKKN